MNSGLTGRTLATSELSAAQIGEMVALFALYYDDVALATFQRDLRAKNWVTLLFDCDAGRLRGFSTLHIYTTTFQQRPVSVVFSGDTVLERVYRGNYDLPRIWIHSVLDLCASLPRPLYWLLISSGYRTYRYLPLFYRTFYPRHDAATPPETQALIDHLATERFGRQYDPQQGVVRFSQGATPLRAGEGEITDDELADPNIVFFVARNPGHVRGDELVCLTEIDPANFTGLGRMMAS